MEIERLSSLGAGTARQTISPRLTSASPPPAARGGVYCNSLAPGPFTLEIVASPNAGLWRPRSFLYYDYMHVYLASSGIIQLLLNATVVRLIRSTAFTLRDLDEFTQAQFRGVVKHRYRKLPTNFWQNRVQTEKPAIVKPLKCFAWECDVALKVMKRLGETVMVPEGVMVEYFALLALADRIILSLQSSDRYGAPLDTAALKASISEFHVEFLRLHGTSAAKIKTHLQHHLPDCIRAHGNVVISCFSCEARARFVKAAAVNSSRLPDAYKSRAPLHRLCIQLEAQLKEFEKGVSIDCKKRRDDLAELLPPHPKPSGVVVGNAIRRPTGMLRGLQFAFAELPCGRRTLCQALTFAQPLFTFDSSSGLVFAIVQAFKQDGRRWVIDHGNICTIPHSKVEECEAVSSDGQDAVVLWASR